MRFLPRSLKGIPLSAIILPAVTFAVIAAIILAGDIIPVKEWLKLPGKYFGQQTSKLATLKERISRISGVVQEGQNLHSIMEGFQLSPENIRLIVKAAQPYADLNLLRAGNQYYVVTGEHGELRGFEYYSDPEHLIKVVETDGAYAASLEVLAVTIKPAMRNGAVVSSLHESFAAAGVGEELAREFIDIFAWEIDFSSELRPGAEWRILYEEKWRDGNVQGDGRLVMAELVNAGKTLVVSWYEAAPGQGAYYTPEGHSTRRKFLKAPFDLRQIAASRWPRASRRGNGVEYDAMPGTPVVAIADGRISSLGSIKGRGKTLTLRHAGGYITQYTHLGGLARAVSKGTLVRQGTVIGYVGPVLKKRSYIAVLVQKGGKAIDPLKLPDLPAVTIASKDMLGFTTYAKEKSVLLHQSSLSPLAPHKAEGEKKSPEDNAGLRR